MRIGAIVVNWNDSEATARCIDSLLDNNPDRLLPIVEAVYHQVEGAKPTAQ